MIIEVEKIAGKVYALDENGHIWRLEIAHDGQPSIRLLDRVPRDSIYRMTLPRLAIYDKDLSR